MQFATGARASEILPSAIWCKGSGRVVANPNLQLVTDAAKLLGPILGELVFVGGCATALLITDKAAADVRPTFDVDAIAEITSYAGYTEFSDRLRKLGFQEDISEGATTLPLAAKDDDARCDAARRKDSRVFKHMVPCPLIRFMGSIIGTATMTRHLRAHRRRSALQTFRNITKRRTGSEPREMSSRSTTVSANTERRRTAGTIPP